MKKITSASSESFVENVTDNVEFKLTKTTKDGNITVYGKILKDGEAKGDVSYDKKGDYLTVQMKPFSVFTEEEFSLLNKSVTQCIIELSKE